MHNWFQVEEILSVILRSLTSLAAVSIISSSLDFMKEHEPENENVKSQRD